RFVPPPVEEIARLFPQFEILGFIGKGGMGAVYKARQPGLDRLVALKVLPPAVGSDPSFAERFTREARALARLNHPNIVAVYDFGTAGALNYLVMEFVDGANLRDVERTGRLSPEQALAIVPQICEALQFAHNEGIVHRDIKPENLLLDKKGRLKITDFGIAKILDVPSGKASLTGAKEVVGTPHYMAPEQIEKPQTVDHRADIYSLGVVFYEMLTGELPLGKFAPPSKKAPVDARLDEVVLHTLEKEPERRYQQASQVKTDVETITGTASKSPQASLKAEGKPTNSTAPLAQWRWLKIPGGAAAAFLVLFLIATLAGVIQPHWPATVASSTPEAQNENLNQKSPPPIPAPPAVPVETSLSLPMKGELQSPLPPDQPAAPLPPVSSILLGSLGEAQMRLTNVEAQLKALEANPTGLNAAMETIKNLQSTLAREATQDIQTATSQFFTAQQQLDLATVLMNLRHAATDDVVRAEAKASESVTPVRATMPTISVSTMPNGTPPSSYQWYSISLTNPPAANSKTDSTRKTVKAADSTDFSQSFDVDPHGKLTMNLDRGAVRITGSDGNTVTVHVTRQVTGASYSEATQILNDEHVVLEQNGNEISVTAENPPELQHLSLFHHLSLDAQYEIRLPRQFDAHVETSGGDINVTGVQGNADIRTMGGQIICNDIAGNLNAHTMGGDMRATECKGRLDLETMGGHITINDFAGPGVHATTSGGSVSADFNVAPTEDCDLETMGGNIAVQLPATAALRLDGHTFGGSETSDFPVEIKDAFGNGTLSGAINGGGPVMTMQTQGGNVEVRKK
ncbi:MAG TPA: protein kinase, partial [Verrucomicrobiae bacterium]